MHRSHEHAKLKGAYFYRLEAGGETHTGAMTRVE
jgi:hypothetical protein